MRSGVVLSGITILTRWPKRAPMSARLMPVLPLDGSRIVWPSRRAPLASASATITWAIRSLTDPVGLAHSSLAKNRTAGLGEIRRSSTIGVWPMAALRTSEDDATPVAAPPSREAEAMA